MCFTRVIEDGSYVFRGLPYAVPPVAELRFRPAQPQINLEDCWTGTYVANRTQPCWSYDSQVGSKDVQCVFEMSVSQIYGKNSLMKKEWIHMIKTC